MTKNTSTCKDLTVLVRHEGERERDEELYYARTTSASDLQVVSFSLSFYSFRVSLVAVGFVLRSELVLLVV